MGKEHLPHFKQFKWKFFWNTIKDCPIIRFLHIKQVPQVLAHVGQATKSIFSINSLFPLLTLNYKTVWDLSRFII